MCGFLKPLEKPFRTGASSAKRQAEQQAEAQRQQEENRAQRIAQGKQQINRIFGELEGGDGQAPIWEQQQQAYMDYATPQLQDQFGDAREGLTYALSRQGQGRGSLSGERFADLSRDYQLQQQEVADRARGYGTQARQNVNDQRMSLMNTLQASADPGEAARQAQSAVQSLSQTPSFGTLGPLFQNVTGGLAAAQQGARNADLRDRVNQIQYGGDPDRATGRVIR